MKVLVLGATGFIGGPAANALVRAGHTVYGLARSETKATGLAAKEIIPIQGDVDSDAWIPLIASLDVIIEAVAASPDRARGTVERVIKAAETLRPDGAPLLSYIYTSGTWVHGDSRTEVFTDTTPIVRSVDIVAWRPAIEQLVLRSTKINGIVVRPAVLYGRTASLFGLLFKTAAEGKVVCPGTPGGRYALVHTDDLADLYVRMAEKASLLGGKILLAANSHTESVDDLLQRLVEVSGAKSYEYSAPANVFEEAIQATTLVRPYLANALLGWSPKKPGLVEGLDIYYRAWLAFVAPGN
ncbi:Epimerase domain-containing protein [Mycena sanguinolenta]|uniref:Epimerase domain-containing protein n=1 Tax=Mycena sanguinolenta TaxID=230812 RepID=A0A8H6YVJ5_9AGAR|nr:Epimerase domain-containing protein [Mycena sanguinolenta]